MENPDIIEVLSCPQTTGDLWDELQRDLDPLKKFLILDEDKEYTVRLLGHFMQVSRIYNPHPSLVAELDIDVKRIASRDGQYFESVTNKIQNIIKSEPTLYKMYNSVGKFLLNVYKNFNFQRCIISNAYIKSGDNEDEPKVKLMALTQAMCNEIVQKVPEANTKISGFNARDITLSRKGSGLITRYDITVEKETLLDRKDIQKIFSQGLVDIPSLLTAINKRSGTFYYQFQLDKYQMPDTLTNTLFIDLNDVEEGNQLRRANQKINTLPRNAFEKEHKPTGAISSLEIE